MSLVNRPYQVRAILDQCAFLQTLETRQDGWGVAELMRLAVRAEVNLEDDTPIVLCRLLFRSASGGPLRRPMLGSPGFLGGGDNGPQWPLEPVHLFRGVPFYVVSMYGLAGLAESGPYYLIHCLRHGVWNPDPYPQPGDDELGAIAREFIKAGPWHRALRRDEREMILAQVP
jgi:hypothetical protein